MRKTIFLPDELGARLEAYLKEHPNETASGLIRELLEIRLRPKRPLSDLLEIAGAFTAIDDLNPMDLQPEDRWVAEASRQTLNK